MNYMHLTKYDPYRGVSEKCQQSNKWQNYPTHHVACRTINDKIIHHITWRVGHISCQWSVGVLGRVEECHTLPRHLSRKVPVLLRWWVTNWLAAVISYESLATPTYKIPLNKTCLFYVSNHMTILNDLLLIWAILVLSPYLEIWSSTWGLRDFGSFYPSKVMLNAQKMGISGMENIGRH